MFAGLPYFQKINYAESTLSAWGIWILILYRIAFRISAIILISLSSSTFACRIIKKYAMTKAAHSQLVPESRSASFATSTDTTIKAHINGQLPVHRSEWMHILLLPEPQGHQDFDRYKRYSRCSSCTHHTKLRYECEVKEGIYSCTCYRAFHQEVGISRCYL